MSVIVAVGFDVTGSRESSVVPAGTVTLYSMVLYKNSGDTVTPSVAIPREDRELSPDASSAKATAPHSQTSIPRMTAVI